MRSQDTWMTMVQLIGTKVGLCCQTADRETARRRKPRASLQGARNTIVEDHFALLLAAGY